MAKKPQSIVKTAANEAGAERVKRPLQLPLPRYLSLVTIQVLLVPICLFTLARRLGWAPKSSEWGRFIDPLVEDPPATLAVACAGLTLVQLHVGRQLSVFRRENDGVAAGTEAAAKAVNPFHVGSVALNHKTTLSIDVQRGCDALVTLAGASAVFHALIFLLGAPLIRNALSTYLFALYIALLALGPAAFVLDRGSDLDKWVRLFSSGSCIGQIDFALLYPAYGTLIGAWLGAGPIAFDWDRPWQRWPVPPVIGGWIGHTLGTIAAVSVCVALAVEEEGRKRKRSS